MENIVYIVSDNRGSKKKSIKKDFTPLHILNADLRSAFKMCLGNGYFATDKTPVISEKLPLAISGYIIGSLKVQRCQELVDDLVQDEIASIIKEYRYNGKTYRLTLYTSEQEFGAEEYISHYRTLTNQYSHDFLTNFDIEVIRQFSS